MTNTRAGTRLSRETFDLLPAAVARPGYDPHSINTGVVHLGLGNFHRAHQAAFFDRALASGDHRWGIIGASLRSPDVQQRLAPQSFLYTLTETGAGGEKTRLMAPIRDVIVAGQDALRLTAALANPDVHIVTLTLTEKGYGSGPGSAADFITAALAQRRDAGLMPFTVISCDNLPENGRVIEHAVLAIAQQRDPSLHGWIAKNAAFPNSMVDRIVPATTPHDIAALTVNTGIEDQAMVKTERFSQWVIEDNFCTPRPDFAGLGVDLVSDVAPWEAAKLRLLNGAHSTLAYLGALAGCDFVHQAIAMQPFRALVEQLWNESAMTLSPDAGLDITAYRVRLLDRFANAALQHRMVQIAMDGSQKIPQRLVAPLRERMACGLESPALILAVAGWMRWQLGRDESGNAIAVDDPMTPQISAALHGLHDPADIVGALLSFNAIFGADLAGNPAFAAKLSAQLRLILNQGAHENVMRAFA
jgi:fructuronate reductase